MTADVIEKPPLRDEKGAIRADFVDEAARAIEALDVPALRVLVGDLHESDLGALLEALEPEQRPRLVELLGIDFDFTALTEVDDSVREEILDELRPQTVADGVRDIETDDAVTILEDMPRAERTEILGHLPADERLALTRSLDYPEDSAGRRMQTEYIAVAPDWTVGRAIDYMRETAELPEQFYELYVVNADGRFLGAVPLDRLLRSKRPVPIAQLMEAERRRVRAGEDQESVARLFQRYDLVAAPVVDANERLVGVITFDDVADVIVEEAEEDIKALGGVTADEELSDSVWTIVRARFTWLLVNLGAAFIAANVLGLFEEQLQKMVALAILAPIVASQGGNAAVQTMTVAVRALATQDLSKANARRVIAREALVGLFNGIAFAVITGVLAYVWFDVPGLGIVIGLAMICNLVAAGLGGIMIPLTLNRLKFDPAVASSPFVTTVTDVIGFSSFLAIATLWFGLR
ncbi:MAG: magnesium transporter [Pseudolabrys sp.]|nr:magnesium transporter [Pseudolabrys sp.]MDP2299032.1 magnesium transporter [Pseudolabrys sp.]